MKSASGEELERFESGIGKGVSEPMGRKSNQTGGEEKKHKERVSVGGNARAT